MSQSEKRLILVDGSSYLFRAYYALPPLTNSHNEPTGAIYGVVNMLRKLMADYPSDAIVVVFDPKGKNFRHELLESYKANRAAMPDDLQQQIAPLHQLIKAMGLPLVIKDGVEADDVIGTLAKHAQQQHYTTLIVTGDKDMAQLVNESTVIVDTMKNKQFDSQGIIEKFGVPPEKIIDYLSLTGDTSDNIPGIPKVGPKTAVKWLTQYDSLAGVIQHADDIKGAVGESLRAHLNELDTFQQLVTIQCDVPLKLTLKDLVKTPAQTDTLRELFTRFEFKNWLKQLDEHNPNQTTTSTKTTQYVCITNKTVFKKLQTELANAKHIALDTETDNLDAMRAKLVGISVSVKSDHAFYIPLTHDYQPVPPQLDKSEVLAWLQQLFMGKDKIIIGHNIIYDLLVLSREGLTLPQQFTDTLLQAYILGNSTNRLSLDKLAGHYLQKTLIPFEAVAGKGKEQKTFNQVELEPATQYAAEDADIALQLNQQFFHELQQTPKLLSVLTTIELPLIPVLLRMRQYGVLIDTNVLKQQSQQLDKKIKMLSAEITELAGETFNINSPKQLQTILFEKLKLPTAKKTTTGQLSTRESVLQELALDYPIADKILHYRHYSKLKSTYTDSLPDEINPETGRVHTSYNQAGTATGRLSSNQPNLQNIPVRTEDGRKIRQAFIAPPNYVLLSADYSQVELRIIAHLSQDPNLLHAFQKNLDIHQATASEIFATALDDVTQEQRRRAKATNFGLLYGMSAFGLAKQLGISRQEAEHYIECYFARYPKVREYIDHTREQAKQQGFVETIYGRRLYVPEINSKQFVRRQAAERAAINAPMQGSAADIIKRAMITIDNWLLTEKIDARMVMQVHDELVLEVHEDIIDLVKHKVCELMQQAGDLTVPLLVDAGVGKNWDEAH